MICIKRLNILFLGVFILNSHLQKSYSPLFVVCFSLLLRLLFCKRIKYVVATWSNYSELYGAPRFVLEYRVRYFELMRYTCCGKLRLYYSELPERFRRVRGDIRRCRISHDFQLSCKYGFREDIYMHLYNLTILYLYCHVYFLQPGTTGPPKPVMLSQDNVSS